MALATRWTCHGSEKKVAAWKKKVLLIGGIESDVMIFRELRMHPPSKSRISEIIGDRNLHT